MRILVKHSLDERETRDTSTSQGSSTELKEIFIGHGKRIAFTQDISGAAGSVPSGNFVKPLER